MIERDQKGKKTKPEIQSQIEDRLQEIGKDDLTTRSEVACSVAEENNLSLEFADLMDDFFSREKEISQREYVSSDEEGIEEELRSALVKYHDFPNSPPLLDVVVNGYKVLNGGSVVSSDDIRRMSKTSKTRLLFEKGLSK